MKKIVKFLKIIFLFLLIAASIGLGYFAYHYYKNPRTQIVDVIENKNHYSATKTDLDLEIASLNTVKKEPKNVDDIVVGGWIPDWGMGPGFDSLQNNLDVKSISPFWFDCSDNGDLVENGHTNWSDMLQYVKDNSIELTPTITCFDRDIITKILNNPESLKTFIDKTMFNVETYNYDGVDLDIEAFYLNDKKLFFNYLAELKDRLNKDNKKLIVSILPKWANNRDYPNFWETSRVEDYKRIGDLADEVRIMAYNFSSANASQAGPIGPLEWQDEIIRYAINSGIPRNKIVLGVHLYAYDWSTREMAPDIMNYYDNTTLHSSGGEKADAFYYATTENIMNKYGLDVKFNDTWGEAVGTYNYFGQKRIVVFMDQKSLHLRKQLAADYGIKGIYYWKLGGEGSLQL